MSSRFSGRYYRAKPISDRFGLVISSQEPIPSDTTAPAVRAQWNRPGRIPISERYLPTESHLRPKLSVASEIRSGVIITNFSTSEVLDLLQFITGCSLTELTSTTS